MILSKFTSLTLACTLLFASAGSLTRNLTLDGVASGFAIVTGVMLIAQVVFDKRV